MRLRVGAAVMPASNTSSRVPAITKVQGALRWVLGYSSPRQFRLPDMRTMWGAIVVFGGMGSFGGALLGGLVIGVVESLGGLYLGESLGQIGIFLIFIGVLLFRPQGLFGAKA